MWKGCQYHTSMNLCNLTAFCPSKIFRLCLHDVLCWPEIEVICASYVIPVTHVIKISVKGSQLPLSKTGVSRQMTLYIWRDTETQVMISTAVVASKCRRLCPLGLAQLPPELCFITQDTPYLMTCFKYDNCHLVNFLQYSSSWACQWESWLICAYQESGDDYAPFCRIYFHIVVSGYY